MRMWLLTALLFFLLGADQTWAQSKTVSDVFSTSQGELVIEFVGHGSLFFRFQGKVIHVDPVGQYGDYSNLPKADLVLVTHEHKDHLDPKLIETLRKNETQIIANKASAQQIPAAIALENGQVKEVLGIRVEAVAAYNLLHMRSPGVPFHPKGQGNGYVINFAEKRVYVAGDTENTPEMKALRQIDIAFLPMNLPYTMTPEMVADAARGFKPRILYPYHYGDTDPQRLVELLKDTPEIEVRIRPMR